MNISEFEYLDNFSDIVSKSYEPLQIYYSGRMPPRSEPRQDDFSICLNRSSFFIIIDFRYLYPVTLCNELFSTEFERTNTH